MLIGIDSFGELDRWTSAIPNRGARRVALCRQLVQSIVTSSVDVPTVRGDVPIRTGLRGVIPA